MKPMLTTIALLFACLHSLADAAQPPNIVLILPDQMRASAMGCDGNSQVKTPNIDRLAAEMQNLATDSAHADLRQELDQKLDALMKRHGDDWKFNSHELVEEGGRLYRYSTFYTLDEFHAWIKANPDNAR